ncbi:MAG: FUSC family protein [Verrucomicrobia bacterium]|nr:FUSC family protein [Verrucomicrobiota bacterium]
MSAGVTDHTTKIEAENPGLFGILWSELKPYPGRDLAALRMAIACTAVVLVSNTFRLPLQDVLPFLVLFTSKEEKITTTITAILALFAITIAVGASLLVFKCTGNRPEFRIPGMAVEIFVGMYLFRVLAVGPVGFILAFIVSVSQSIVDLYPTPEDAVHEFLWVWVAVALGAGLGWLANLVLFPVPARRVLQREFVDSWQKTALALKQLMDDSPAAARRSLRPLVKRGPVRLLKLLKLSLIEAPNLGPKQTELTRLILALDKIVRLLISYSTRPSGDPLSSADNVILNRLKERAEHFETQFVDGFMLFDGDGPEPSPAAAAPNDARQRADNSGTLQLVEAERTLEDLAAPSGEASKKKTQPPAKKSLFVADAFTNPRHVQFALKVTLAGMIGYIFYTASDYFGIHTIYYTPLIIALGSTGATIHKGFLRIVGCVIGGGLGLICTIWVIPRFETLGMYLFIVFCVHGLAAWIAFGSERISYLGLQIALTFDLGVLKDFGPPKEIDPIRDRFIGIILGIFIISVVFALVWPEDARSFVRQKLAGCLRSIARLLSLGGSPDSKPQRQQLELEIASHLGEANTYEEQASFEALLYGKEERNGANLKDVTSLTEELYAVSLPWIREQAATLSAMHRETASPAQEIATPLVDSVEVSAAIIEGSYRLQTTEEALSLGESLSETEAVNDGRPRSQSFELLAAAVRELSRSCPKGT